MSRDLRRYARQTNVRLVVGALFLIFVVGDGMIFLIYGSGPALLGLLCLLGGMLPVVLTVLVLWLLDWITKRANRE